MKNIHSKLSDNIHNNFCDFLQVISESILVRTIIHNYPLLNNNEIRKCETHLQLSNNIQNEKH